MTAPPPEPVDAKRLLLYIEEVSAVLESCAEMIDAWGAYAEPYFQQKHCLEADVEYARSHAKRAKSIASGEDRLGEFDE